MALSGGRVVLAYYSDTMRTRELLPVDPNHCSPLASAWHGNSYFRIQNEYIMLCRAFFVSKCFTNIASFYPHDIDVR